MFTKRSNPAALIKGFAIRSTVSNSAGGGTGGFVPGAAGGCEASSAASFACCYLKRTGFVVKLKLSKPVLSIGSKCPLRSLAEGGFHVGLPLSFTPKKQALISNLPSLALAFYSAILRRFWRMSWL